MAALPELSLLTGPIKSFPALCLILAGLDGLLLVLKLAAVLDGRWKQSALVL